MDCDVAVVGGGPAGSTTGCLLKKYMPEARVLILERERFPREHVGESQLPAITPILAEMGDWDKVEAAGFPIKTGAMYRWGSSDDLWKLDFLIGEKFEAKPRPQPLRGQRLMTTFHVDRAIYDQILLEHARGTGCEVREQSRVVSARRDGDRIEALVLDGGEEVRARWYVDASGHAGILRRHMGVGVSEPTRLKNIAFWAYWNCPDWAHTVCKGGVRVRIFSIGSGWVWFIPLGTTRASVGFVTHAEHYRSSGLEPEDIYARALAADPFMSEVMRSADRERRLFSTKDWSFTAERVAGQNWFLVGESAGFADPILAAGMSLAQVGARELAHVLAALLRGEHDPAWLTSWYEEITLRPIRQHIRFADYWYSANAHFTDLKAYTTEIARDAGFDLDPDTAFRWLSIGGFASDSLDGPIVGSYHLSPAKAVLQRLTGRPATWQINRFNEFRLNLVGAREVTVPRCKDGVIEPVRCYRREARLLPVRGAYKTALSLLAQDRDAVTIVARMRQVLGAPPGTYHPMIAQVLDAIEAMIAEGWVQAKLNKRRPMLRLELNESSLMVSSEEGPLIPPPAVSA